MTIYEKFLDSLANGIAVDFERHPNGIGLADFFEEYSALTQDQIMDLIAQLERRNIYRLKHTPAGARLMSICS
jgi:hypothetical protein